MENIDKLPKWAQAKIKDLERERETSIRALNEYVNTQTPSPFYIDHLECTGEQKGPSKKIQYIQTHQMTVEHLGVRLDLILRDDGIDLQWGNKDFGMGDVGFIPRSYQSALLKPKDKMR